MYVVSYIDRQPPRLKDIRHGTIPNSFSIPGNLSQIWYISADRFSNIHGCLIGSPHLYIKRLPQRPLRIIRTLHPICKSILHVNLVSRASWELSHTEGTGVIPLFLTSRTLNEGTSMGLPHEQLVHHTGRLNGSSHSWTDARARTTEVFDA